MSIIRWGVPANWQASPSLVRLSASISLILQLTVSPNPIFPLPLEEQFLSRCYIMIVRKPFCLTWIMSFGGLPICLLSVCQTSTHSGIQAIHVGAIIMDLPKSFCLMWKWREIILGTGYIINKDTEILCILLLYGS